MTAIRVTGGKGHDPANGVDGDTILLGPPFVVTDAELDRIVAVLADTIEAVVPSTAPAGEAVAG